MRKTIAIVLLYILTEVFSSMIMLVVLSSFYQNDIEKMLFLPQTIVAGVIMGFYQLSIALFFFRVLSKYFLSTDLFKNILTFRFADFIKGSFFAFLVLTLLSLTLFWSHFQSFQILDITPRYLVLGFIATLVLVIKEEIVFRGFVLGYMENKTRRYVAIIFSSVLFGAVHAFTKDFDFLSFIEITTSGLILSILFYKKKNIWLPIGLHFGWNYFILFIYNTDEDMFSTPFLSGTKLVNSVWIDSAYLLLIMLICVVLFITNRKNIFISSVQLNNLSDEQTR